ncbi:hypothetical protein PG988_015378 [Apiospora saccharicola]
MPLKREADDSPGPPGAAKIAKTAQLPNIEDVVADLKTLMEKGDFAAACDAMREALVHRDSVITGHESTVSQLKKEDAKLQDGKEQPNEVEELRKQNIVLKRELNKANMVRLINESCARRVECQNQIRIERMNDAHELATELLKEVTAWREATKNLQSAVLYAEAGVNTAAVDVGRDNPSANPPNYLLDVDVAQKIVDFYERAVDGYVANIHSCLTYNPVPDDWDEDDSGEDKDEDED